MFIFLIVFFFITFLGTLRWCNIRTRPRRETRGVSRSKCGDLITACVPVTWAISIIVYESADSTDLNDGFGTGELVVGVRAYQWGWEYYYPKSIDLNYNVKPSYSTFIGNSLKYNYSSGYNLDSNNLWKLYQNKLEDKVVTPMYTLLIPTSDTKITPQINGSLIGSNTLKGSEAFSKVTNCTKSYNTNLIYTPTPITYKYTGLHKLYPNNNSFINTITYGFNRQHNLISPLATTNTSLTFFDVKNQNRFLAYTLSLPKNLNKTLTFEQNYLDYKETPVWLVKQNYTRLTNFLTTSSHHRLNPTFMKLISFNNSLLKFNDDSDKNIINYPLLKVLNLSLVDNCNLDWREYSDINFLSNRGYSKFNPKVKNLVTNTNKIFSAISPNNKILPSDQSVRQYSKIQPNASDYNLSDSVNTITSNNYFSNQINPTTSLASNYFYNISGYSDLSVPGKILSKRYFMPSNHLPNLSNNPYLTGMDHNSMESKLFNVNSNKNNFKT